MSEYIDWQPENSRVKVRVHRRVLAGMEQEGVGEFRGVLLGSASPVTKEVLVEDFARLEPGPIEEWFAGWNRHSLPAVGYFRVGSSEHVEITQNDRELFARHFPDAMSILLLVRLQDGKAQLAPIPAVAGGRVPEREAAQPVGQTGPAARLPLRESEPGSRMRERGAGERLPFRDRETGGTAAGLAAADRVSLRERETARPVAPVVPPERIPFREREFAARPPAEPARPHRTPFDSHLAPPRDPGRFSRIPRRYLGQAAAVGAGFVLGVLGYLAFRSEKPRPLPPAKPPVSSTQPATQTPGPTRGATPASPAKTTVMPASTPRPSPFEGSSEANRSMDPGTPGDAATRGETQQQIRQVVAHWGDTLLSGDVGKHVDLYAPTVGPYFTKSRVTRAQVRDDVRQMLDKYGRMTVYKISDLTITPVDANHAFATFHKRWETEGKKFAGEEREQLKLTRQGSEWQIASERELKVYWVRKR